MDTYLHSIHYAALLFPLIAIIFTIPYISILYRRYGSVLLSRVIIVYSFIFYIQCCYFLTILPLPPIDEVAYYTQPYVDLIPFHFISEYFAKTSYVIGDPSSFWNTINELYFYEPFFNAIMLIPLGIYLRYYYEKTFFSTILISFLLSLSFELIQLSALFGIYPRPYRLFQVDDLILNVFGAIIGFIIAPLICYFFPTREELDTISYKRGNRITWTRRFISLVTDLMISSLLMVAFYFLNVFRLENKIQLAIVSYLSNFILSFIIIPLLSKGKTLGNMSVGIQLITNKNTTPKIKHYLMRYAFLFLEIIPPPFLMGYILFNLGNFVGIKFIFLLIIALFFCGLSLYNLVTILSSLIRRKKCLFYEELSCTKFKTQKK